MRPTESHSARCPSHCTHTAIFSCLAVIIELALAIKYGQAWIDFGVLCGIQVRQMSLLLRSSLLF